MEAAERLASKGVECTVVNARFVKPLDSSLILDVARRTRRVVTVEENALCGGFGSLVDELLKTAHISDLRLERIGLPDEFVTHGSQEILRAKYNLDADGITQRIISSFPDLIRLTQAKR
jgi:1-deoxy-D-xylulose-5-phosphate synthase